MPPTAKLYKMPTGKYGTAYECAEYAKITVAQFRNRAKKYGDNSPRLWDEPDERWKGGGARKAPIIEAVDVESADFEEESTRFIEEVKEVFSKIDKMLDSCWEELSQASLDTANDQ